MVSRRQRNLVTANFRAKAMSTRPMARSSQWPKRLKISCTGLLEQMYVSVESHAAFTLAIQMP
jgi:hypothetical protein